MRALILIAALIVATVARADNAATPGAAVSVGSGAPPVSLTGLLTGTFNARDIILGRVANTSVSNSQTQLSEVTAFQLQVSPSFTNLHSGYYFTFDSSNINAANAALYASSSGWGATVWTTMGLISQYAAGPVGPGIMSRSTNIYNGFTIVEESAKPICFGTTDTERMCILGGGGLSIDESTASASASHAVLYDDSTSHSAKLSNNGDNFDDVARVSGAIATSDVTNSTATPSVVTTVTLAASGRYSCEAQGVLSESVAADGFQVVSALATGTATKASIGGELYDAAGLHANGEAASSALTLSDTNASTGHYVLHYAIVVSTAATWTVSTGQQSHTTGTLTTRAGATATCTRL